MTVALIIASRLFQIDDNMLMRFLSDLSIQDFHSETKVLNVSSTAGVQPCACMRLQVQFNNFFTIYKQPQQVQTISRVYNVLGHHIAAANWSKIQMCKNQ